MALSGHKAEQFAEKARQELMNRARKSMLAFTLYTKQDYQINWHHRALCKKLDDFAYGRIKRLMVFMPPRHGKSELVSRRLPAFLHGLYPNAELMAASYSGSLAKDMTTDVQRIMDTDEYRELFPDSRITSEGKKTQWARSGTDHELLPIMTASGRRMILKGKYRGQGVGGTFTGRGANFIIIDDPIKGREAADSTAFREKLWAFYKTDLRTRLEENGQILITLTRWHEDDLAGRLLDLAKVSEDADQWDILNFPALREDMLDPLDIRKVGEPLWPQKYDVRALAAIRTQDERDWNALFQQRPAPDKGNIADRGWWRYYKVKPDRFDKIIFSWDLTFKEGQDNDYTVGQAWGVLGADRFLLSQFRAKIGFLDQVREFQNMVARYPEARAKLVEDAANGAALVSLLRSKIQGIIPVAARDSKLNRAKAITPFIHSGNVYLPDRSIAPWIDKFVEEWAVFPYGKHDDQVDATSQALEYLAEKRVPMDWGAVSMTKPSNFMR